MGYWKDEIINTLNNAMSSIDKSYTLVAMIQDLESLESSISNLRQELQNVRYMNLTTSGRNRNNVVPANYIKIGRNRRI